jgi:O-antigen/teichoic acid export membrane protein
MGKVGSAGLNFTAFLMVARLLTTTDYGYYAAALAVVELGLALSSFGLEWVSGRYIPEYRILATQSQLRRFVLQLAGLQSTIYLVFAAGMAIGSGFWAALIGIPDAAPILAIYAIYMLLEGSSRMLRDQMLCHLLLQGRAQVALILRNLVWVAGLGWFFVFRGSATIHDVALIETCAAATGLVFAGIALLVALLNAEFESRAAQQAWVAPSVVDMWKLARATYLGYLFSLAYGPQVLTLLITKLSGVEATAAFGFARNLAEQVRRYLPAELLLGLVRPALIARYVSTQDFVAFNRNATLMFLVSLLVLAPLLVLVIVFGDLVVAVLSHGKYSESGRLLMLQVLSLAPLSHRRIIELIANTLSRAEACTRANAYVMVFPVFMALLLASRQPVWTVLVVSFFAEITYSGLVVYQLRRGQVKYVFPWDELGRIGLVVGLASVAVALWPMALDGLVGLVIAFGLSILGTAAVLLAVRPLNPESFNLIRRLAAK